MWWNKKQQPDGPEEGYCLQRARGRLTGLILEQRDPENSEHGWFIQCAIALQGPDMGKYAVEIGCPASDGPHLWERMVPDVQAAVEFFFKAYQQRGVGGSGIRETEV